MQSKIRDVIIETALKEDALINASGQNKGLFDMPELAFVFEVGKQVAFRNGYIFKSKYFDWYTEYTFDKAGGPSDLIFEYGKDENVKKIVIEFKLVNRIETYLDDIEKLHRIRENNVIKLFCGLKDLDKNEIDKKDSEQKLPWRLQDIEKLKDENKRKIEVSMIDECFSFKTGAKSGNGKDIHCLISLWEVQS